MPSLLRPDCVGRFSGWLAALCLALPTLAVAAPQAGPLSAAQQVVVVIAPSWDAPQARLQAFERVDGHWQPQAESFDVALGRSGSAWGQGLHPAQPDGLQKREGDGRSPAGVFRIGDAFGYAHHARTGLNYQAMQRTSYCIDVPASPLYNRIVDADTVGTTAVEGSTEPMRLDLHNKGDIRYREGFVIEHNAQNVSGAGSCIFAHLRRSAGEATAGCTAMEPENMERLLAWLDSRKQPMFVLLPEGEYARLQAAWALPVLAEVRP